MGRLILCYRLYIASADAKAYMAQRTKKAEWVREMCEWICGARDTRLAAVIEWAQLSPDAELVVTHFLAMEADARMRNDHATSTDTANGAMVAATSSATSEAPETAPAPAASEAASAASCFSETASAASCFSASL